jgi:tRNA(Arg) A34 adenosine deaminase TadA
VNTAQATGDPTDHAEIAAIRAAAQALGRSGLEASTLYASCEPCVMCAAALLWSGVARVVYCLRREAAMRLGFPDVVSPCESRRLLSSVAVLHALELEEDATHPFEMWTQRGSSSA